MMESRSEEQLRRRREQARARHASEMPGKIGKAKIKDEVDKF